MKKKVKLDRTEKKQTVRWLLKYASPFIPVLSAAVVLAVVSAIFSRRIPVIVGNAVDVISGENSFELGDIAKILAAIPICIALSSVFDYIMRLLATSAGTKLTENIRNDCMKKIQRLPLSGIDRRPRGDIMSRIIADTDRFSEGLVTGVVDFFAAASSIIVTLVIMFMLNPIVAAAVALLTPLSMIVAGFIANSIFNLFKKSSELNAGLTSTMEESLSGAEVVKAFCHEKQIDDKFAKDNEEYRKIATKAVFFSSLTNPTTRFMNSLIYVAVALSGGLIAIGGGSLTVGGLVTLLSFSKDYAKPFNDLSGVLAETESAIASASRVRKFLEEKELEPEKTASLEIDEDGSAGISVRDVCFSYNEKPFMENLSFDAEKGSKIAVVGPTGCGKTTLVNLFMRFYNVNSGKIFIGNQDISEVSKESLRSSFGMVLQDTWISSGTVRDNIAIGKPDATDEEIIAAAKLSHAHSFIKRLPDGYNTVLGEDGGRLSAGERQLLCISRIMLTKPELLILDEATSSIDTRTEMKIQEAFGRLMEGRTSLIVAHRLNTIKNADLILVMKNGNIIEQGTHNELMEKQGFYYNLFTAQFA